MARYGINGSCIWVKTVYPSCVNSTIQGNAVALNGSALFVTGGTNEFNNSSGIFVNKFDPLNGNSLYQSYTKVAVGGPYPYGIGSGHGIVATACDVFVSGHYDGSVQFGLANSQVLNAANYDFFVSKLAANGNVNFGAGFTDCTSSSQLCATNGVNYSWSPGGQTTSCINVSPTVSTTYNVTVTDPTTPCSRTIPITFNPSYPANAGPDWCVACPGGCISPGTVLPGSPFYSWTPAGSLVCPTCPQPTACSYNISTVFTVTVTYPGCTSTSDQVGFHGNCLPCRIGSETLNENSGENLFSINPNPNNGIFIISGAGDNDPVIIYDSFGRMVKKIISTDNKISVDLSDQPKGIYMITTEKKNDFRKVIIH